MSNTLISDLKRQLAAERDYGKRLQKQLDAILRTDGPDEAVERDAARYRWLAKMWPLEITRLVHSHHWHGPTSSELGGAIDAAMKDVK